MFFSYNFKNCSQISMKFGRWLQQLMLSTVCSNFTWHEFAHYFVMLRETEL